MSASENSNNNDLNKVLKNVISEGVHVDKTLRTAPSYSQVSLLEIKTEIFSAISSILHTW